MIVTVIIYNYFIFNDKNTNKKVPYRFKGLKPKLSFVPLLDMPITPHYIMVSYILCAYSLALYLTIKSAQNYNETRYVSLDAE